jgi:hypothetical protein
VYTGPATSYNASNKSAGTWCYQARATNTAGSSAWSGNQCATLAAPALSIADKISAAAGAQVLIPVTFDAQGNNITSLLFSVDYDQTRLSFDSNNTNAVQFRSDLPASFVKSFTFNASDTAGELDFTVADFAAAPRALPGDNLLTIQLTVVPGTGAGTEAAVAFAQTSFGSPTGDINGATDGGSVLVVASSPASIALTANPTSLTADGVSTSSVTALVKDGAGAALPNQPVTFATTLGSITPSATTNSSGVATVTLTAATTAGTATVTASAGSARGMTTVTFTSRDGSVVLLPFIKR